MKLRSFGAQIAASHPSTICRAVATAVQNIHLAAFQRKVLQVEEGILKKDAGLVGAYNIVPLTAVVGEFGEWTRRMEWLWDMTEFMLKKERAEDGTELFCTGAAIANRLRSELQTGYLDIEETARSLLRVAETAWVKQVSAWILYGRLPGFGADDFFVQHSLDADEVRACIVRKMQWLEANMWHRSLYRYLICYHRSSPHPPLLPCCLLDVLSTISGLGAVWRAACRAWTISHHN